MCKTFLWESTKIEFQIFNPQFVLQRYNIKACFAWFQDLNVDFMTNCRKLCKSRTTL